MRQVNGSHKVQPPNIDAIHIYALLVRLKSIYDNKLGNHLDMLIREDVAKAISTIKDCTLLPFVSRGVEEAVQRDVEKMLEAETTTN